MIHFKKAETLAVYSLVTGENIMESGVCVKTVAFCSVDHIYQPLPLWTCGEE